MGLAISLSRVEGLAISKAVSMKADIAISFSELFLW